MPVHSNIPGSARKATKDLIVHDLLDHMIPENQEAGSGSTG